GAARVGADGCVVAIEPSTVLADRIKRQLARNELDNARVVREAVSDHVGRVSVEPGPAEHTGLTRALAESTDESSVPCRPLPQMIHDDEWRRIRLIKIDVE